MNLSIASIRIAFPLYAFIVVDVGEQKAISSTATAVLKYHSNMNVIGYAEK